MTMQIPRYDITGVAPYGEFRQLPRGGYIGRIYNVEVLQNSRGSYLKVSCDITEGEYANFFLEDYHSQNAERQVWRGNCLVSLPNEDGTEADSWTKRGLATFVQAVEKSNDGYKFDWTTESLKNKSVGLLVNIREWRNQKGEIKQGSNIARLCPVSNIRNGTFTVPADKLINKEQSETPDYSNVAIPF